MARKPASPTAPPRVPAVLLGRYEMIEKLGHGGMGVVYRARDMQLGRDVAIKLVVARNEILAARLLREAQALAQLSHPNVVAVYDVGQTEAGVFVAMELVAGKAGDEWLREKRPWREVVRVFRDAGRGLAAAHAVGLVHRDFKPGNLILGEDGRVRVLDFGLARTASLGGTGSNPALTVPMGDEDETHDLNDDRETAKLRPSKPDELESADANPQPSQASIRSRSERSPSLLESPLTEVGTLVGTPPYMAPEQHLGKPSDARSDQFSFCVSLYRALYGERPFGGKNYGELKANIVSGTIVPPPGDADVPAWLRAIVLRGLAVDPDKRWPSMAALLHELERDPDARRRKVAIGAATAALLAATAGVVAWQVRRDPAAVCRSDGHELAGVWDASRKDAVRAAFTKTGKPFAADALATVTRTLDGYTNRWLAMRSDACLATHVRGTQSAELLDLRMTCLQHRLDDVHALVDVLAAADGAVVARAGDALGSLPALDGCADAEALRASLAPPTDPKTRTRAEAALRTLASVRALWVAGRYAEAQQQLAPVLTEARTLGWRPLEGRALLAQAQLADATGDYPAAARTFKEAAIAAEAGRDDETAALARNFLVWVTGERLGNYAEAQELAKDAAAKVERLGRSELLQADLDQKMAALFLEQGDYKEAERRSRHVLELRQKKLAADDPAIASALGDLGDVNVQLMHNDEAIDYYERALAIAEKALGPQHSMCGMLRNNLATALHAKGKANEALAQLERARDITERALGPDHSQLGSIAIDIGNILLEQGKVAEAAAQFRKASEIWTRALGADHPNVGTAMFRGGEVALEQGKPAEAKAAFQRALEIWQAKLGAEHPSLAAAHVGLGNAALAEHHAADALGHYQRALALLDKAMGADNAALIEPLAAIGKAQVALGKPRLALPALERALAIANAQTDPLELATSRLAIARVLVGIDAARGRTLATQAHDVLAAAGPDHARDAEAAAALARTGAAR